jgi:hypothetical protein
MTPGDRQDIFDASMEQEVVYQPGKDGSSEPVMRQKNNLTLDRELTCQRAVVDWENHFDRDGNPMECTPENIVRAIREIDGWVTAVKIFMAELDDILEKEDKAQEKNLSTT